MSNFGFFSSCWSLFESLVNSSFSFANLSFSSPVDFNSTSNRSRNSSVISVCVSASQRERVGETLLLSVSTSIYSTDTSFTGSASKSISVQEMSVFLFLALEFEVASDLYRIRPSRFFYSKESKIDGRRVLPLFSPPSQWVEQIRLLSEFKFKLSFRSIHILAEYILPWVFDKMPEGVHGSSWNYLGTKGHSK